MNNILAATNIAIINKTFTSGLSSYTQAHCQCTLTDDGYRIYRTPNKTVSGDGRVMWGGFVFKPFDVNANALVKGHSYIIRFEVKGKTSNALDADVGWHNNVGWDGGGLTPQPSNVVYTPIPANFQSDDYIPWTYSWTINDDIDKTCTTSYSSFVAGTVYKSYRDFKFGFQYTDTGAMGTDLYIRNLRMYDITTKSKEIHINKNGVVNAGYITENKGKAQFGVDGDVYSQEIIEI